jgi:peroxiredoxin Q/BCP
MPIPAGDIAPDFNLLDEQEKIHHLSDYRGKFVVLYFYPRDDTPGCTKEACGFRDDYSDYEKAGVTILGVSPDTSQSHLKFKSKYDLPFTLLADQDHKVSEKYGVWGTRKIFGRESNGILRTTFLIGVDGEILKVFEKVRPANHSAEILAVFDQME